MRAVRPTSNRLVRTAAVLLAVAGLVSIPSGVSAVILSTTTWHGHDYVLREVTSQPGGETGWHYHDGPPFRGRTRSRLRDVTVYQKVAPDDLLVHDHQHRPIRRRPRR